jgi:hypothetical protein
MSDRETLRRYGYFKIAHEVAYNQLIQSVTLICMCICHWLLGNKQLNTMILFSDETTFNTDRMTDNAEFTRMITR